MKRLIPLFLTCFGALSVMAAEQITSPTQAAWDRFVETLREQRETLLAHPVASDLAIRAQGLYALLSQESSAFNMYVEPRQQYPRFTLPVMPQPVGYSWGMPCPDFLSYIAFVDGTKNYRIYGKRKNNYWSTLQLFSSFWGEGTVKMLEQDQQAGRQVQMRMLPATPMVLNDYVFSHTVIPSLYLSGDFTDYFTVGDDYVIFFMADVSGHGSSSAFATVLLKNLFARKRSDYSRRHDETILEPVAMLKHANKELLDLDVDKFATMVVGLLDMRQHTLRYSVAGHLPLPVLVSDEGARYLEGEGSTVGLMEDAVYEEHTIDLPERFMLALFSDGILEILPPMSLIEKEQYFLRVFEQTTDSPDQLASTAPDDIAALFVIKRD